MQYDLAQEPKLIAEEMIPKFHDHLSRSRIEYVFLSETPNTKGKELYGRARKKGGLDAFLAAQLESEPADFFVIEFSKPIWDQLTKNQKHALVDHELSHCWLDEEGALKILPHDVEEFSGVIKRHGLWRPDIEHFAEIAAKHVRQLDLPMAEPKIVKGNGKAKDAPVFTVDLEKKCSKCDRPGATDDGLCMKCGGGKEAITEALINNLPPIQETVNQKRGRTRPATAGR